MPLKFNTTIFVSMQDSIQTKLYSYPVFGVNLLYHCKAQYTSIWERERERERERKGERQTDWVEETSGRRMGMGGGLSPYCTGLVGCINTD